MLRRKLIRSLGALPLAPILGMAQPQSVAWPSGPVRVLVGFTPGNASDVVARVFAEELAKAAGGTFVVENRPGASGTLALEATARAPADGQTLLYGNSSAVSVAPGLYKLKFDPVADVEPVAMVARAPLVLVVREDFPATTLRQFISYAADPAKDLSFGSNGNGAMNHLAMELLKSRSGARAVHVPYKGGPQALNDLFGGSIQAMFEATASVMPHIRSGRVRALAVSAPARMPELPDVPAVSELYPGFDAVTWAAFFVRTGTPSPVMARLNAAINQAARHPSVRDKLASLGTQSVDDSTPASTKAFWLRDLEKWTSLVKTLNITVS